MSDIILMSKLFLHFFIKFISEKRKIVVGKNTQQRQIYFKKY